MKTQLCQNQVIRGWKISNITSNNRNSQIADIGQRKVISPVGLSPKQSEDEDLITRLLPLNLLSQRRKSVMLSNQTKLQRKSSEKIILK